MASSSYWPEEDLRKQKKEEAFLNRTQLCIYNRTFAVCRYGAKCNFAHALSDLQMPEESWGVWSEAWRKGDVDMSLWEEYIPNMASLERFERYFWMSVMVVTGRPTSLTGPGLMP